MKKIFSFIFLLLTFSIHSQKSDLEILEKTLTQLNDLESVYYTSRYESNESNVTYFHREDLIYFDFSDKTNKTTPRYYINSKESELIYDGKKHIQSLVQEKLIVTGGSRNPNNPLLLTLYPIKELLPQLIANKNVEISSSKDVLINGNNCYLFEFKLKNSIIDWENLAINTYDKKDVQYTTYSLLINMSDYFPRKIIIPNGPTGTLSRTIDKLNINYDLDSRTWTGELLPSDYATITFQDYIKLMESKMNAISKNNTPPDDENIIGSYQLPSLESDTLVDFSKFNGKVVLLEFWFKFCGPCVKAVPELNSIYSKYKGENFIMYGIEFIENFPRENLQAYASKIKMNYPLLYKGKELADAFGISAAPTILIIDRNGNIVFMESGFDPLKIANVLKKYL